MLMFKYFLILKKLNCNQIPSQLLFGFPSCLSQFPQPRIKKSDKSDRTGANRGGQFGTSYKSVGLTQSLGLGQKLEPRWTYIVLGTA